MYTMKVLTKRCASFVQNRSLSKYLSTSTVFSTDTFLPPYARANTEAHIDPIRVHHSRVSDSDIQFFKELLGPSRCITDPSEVDSFNLDWQGIYKGKGRAVLKPKTVQEVSKILAYCNERRLPVVPQGGNTSQVGSAVPVEDELIMSMSLMRAVLSFSPDSGVLVAEAGCVLGELQELAAREGLVVPLDLGAKGSCMIGGNVSTHAGGKRLIRYGNLHGSVLGLEAVRTALVHDFMYSAMLSAMRLTVHEQVLPSGEVLDCMSTVRKDNTGYDLKQLIIGSEGTLAVVTKVAIQLAPQAKHVAVTFFGLEDFESLLRTFRTAQKVLGVGLHAAECMDSNTMDAVVRNLHFRNPLAKRHPFYLLTEGGGSRATELQQNMEEIYDLVSSDSSVKLNDAVSASEPSKMRDIWKVRELVFEAIKLEPGFTYRYDISLPSEKFYLAVRKWEEKWAREVAEEISDPKIDRYFGYGHVGDGNIHFDLQSARGAPYSAALKKAMDKRLYAFVCSERGSLNAEHGLGRQKFEYLAWQRPPAFLRLMAQLKRAFDPHCILNPYKVLPPPFFEPNPLQLAPKSA